MTQAPGLGLLPHRFPKLQQARLGKQGEGISSLISLFLTPMNDFHQQEVCPLPRPCNSVYLGPSGVFGGEQAVRAEATGQGTKLADPSANIYPKMFPNSVCLRWECSLGSPWLAVPSGTCRESKLNA